ncbi:CatB-related O-acetyltransferase [Methylobacterium aquaticum]|uniref:CatB-related O-acetyltransferase n=1 Tax=Methylobacterium aquaticum TaxID=270351 RepID=UPI002485F1D3|nr:CatB-related O-acetyltransferase [Methylobacterium aquaticum]
MTILERILRFGSKKTQPQTGNAAVKKESNMTNVTITDEMKAKLYERGVECFLGSGMTSLPINSVFEAPCSIKWMQIIGRCSIGAFSYAVSGHYNNVTIGRYVSIGEEVSVGRGNHPVQWLSTSPFFYIGDKMFSTGGDFSGSDQYNQFRPDTTSYNGFFAGAETIIENDVWIGHRAYISPGVKIANGAIVGAESVVTKDVPAYSIVVGNPARVVKTRFAPELVERLLASRWWTLAPWQLAGIDLSRPEVSIDEIERRVSNTPMYDPGKIHLSDLI